MSRLPRFLLVAGAAVVALGLVGFAIGSASGPSESEAAAARDDAETAASREILTLACDEATEHGRTRGLARGREAGRRDGTNDGIEEGQKLLEPISDPAPAPVTPPGAPIVGPCPPTHNGCTFSHETATECVYTCFSPGPTVPGPIIP